MLVKGRALTLMLVGMSLVIRCHRPGSRRPHHNRTRVDNKTSVAAPGSNWAIPDIAPRPPVLRVEGVAQAVAEEVQREQRDGEERRREDQAAALLKVCRRLPCDAPASRPGDRRRFIHRRQIAVWQGGRGCGDGAGSTVVRDQILAKRKIADIKAGVPRPRLSDPPSNSTNVTCGLRETPRGELHSHRRLRS